jgi:DNA adenine methylase
VKPRPALRYYGGKWRLAPWILSFFPEHRVYVEPYGGAASVLLQKPLAYAEVYNDLDGEVVNVFRVLRDERASAVLADLLKLTPYSREDYIEAYSPAEEPIERARRTIIKSFMGFGTASIHRERPCGMRTTSSLWKAPTGFRDNTTRCGTTPAHDWMHYPKQLAGFVERLRGVVIENRDAVTVMRSHDSDETLHFVDPPYVLSTRERKEYKHEMSDHEHIALAQALHGLRGMVVVSGYASKLYDEVLYRGWQRHTCAARAGGRGKSSPREEVVWLNPACSAAIGRKLAA